MSDLFLRIRLDALERNLRDVKDLVEDIGHRYDSVRQLQGLLGRPAAGAVLSLRRATDAVKRLSEQIGEMSAEQGTAPLLLGHDLSPQLTKATESLHELDRVLKQAQAYTDRLSLDASETDALISRQHVRKHFEKDAKELLLDVMKLRKGLGDDSAASAASGGSDPWLTYRRLLDKIDRKGDVGDQNQVGLFQEYVDVAAGLSLRGMGMDDHFCAMADRLSDDWTEVISLDQIFAIPARDQPARVASIIRLGFPEWTIWALPLFAHDFGLVLVDKDHGLRDLAEELAGALPDQPESDIGDPGAREEARAAFRLAHVGRIRTYLADVFATYVMGPAYASACLLLKLDPGAARSPLQDRGWDLVRARVVLTTLRRMNPPLQGHLTTSIGLIEQSWQSALSQLGQPIPDDLDDGWIEHLVDEVINALTLIEELNEVTIRFDDASFGRAQGHAQLFFGDLLTSTGPVPNGRPSGGAPSGDDSQASRPRYALVGVTLAEVLNAAWYQRLQHPAQEIANKIAVHVQEEIWPYLKPFSPLEAGGHRPPSGDIRP